MNLVRDRVRKSAGVTHVCFSASHTHSGPAIDEFYTAKRPAWNTAALDKIAVAIESAATKLTPALIASGAGSVFIGHNRRFIQPDGKVKMLWRNQTKIPTHPLDPRVGVIRVDSAGGNTLAVVINYACHPVVFGPDNLRYSADYPGAATEVVEKSFGSDCVCLFMQGGSGDINPYFDKMKLEEGAETLMWETGRRLGGEALRVAKSLVPTVPRTPEIQVSLETRKFKPRYENTRLLEKLRTSGVGPEFLDRYRKHLATPMDCVVTTVLLNREIAIMGMPGEPFVEFGLGFRDRVPGDLIFRRLLQRFPRLLPHHPCRGRRGRWRGRSDRPRRSRAGEAMLDMAVIRLLTMQGLLKTEP